MTLASRLHSLDGKSYGAYKSLQGRHDLGSGLTLHIDRVQSDPYAPPSQIRVTVDRRDQPIPDELLGAAPAATVDHLTRRVAAVLPRGGKEQGQLSVDIPGQQVLARTSVIVGKRELDFRLEAAFPARGRRIKGGAAATLLTETLPRVMEQALAQIDLEELREAVALYLDQEELRSQLTDRGLIAFVANGSVLPRRSGASDLPLGDAVAFAAPESLQETIELSSGRVLTGLALPRGVTVIVGGGFHGKSTLLRTLQHGVYNHVVGDGREFAVTVADAAALRAEDGRAVTGVDISQFITDLPSGTDTTSFTTANASGSTSQAASLAEALEAGSSALLIDEDTSATNFMIRDDRMRQLVPADLEPITPFIDRVRALWDDVGVSTVLVAGGSGSFLDVADQVIMMNGYRPVDVTGRARELAEPIASQPTFPLVAGRVVSTGWLPSGKQGGGQGKKGPKPPQAKGVHTIRVGEGTLELAALDQLVSDSQTRAIAVFLQRLGQLADGQRTLSELVDALLADPPTEGRYQGRTALPRKHEIMAAVNRHRQLRLK